MTQSTLTTSYVSGHSEEEIQCLLRQSRLYDPCTRRFLEQASITAGMKVLDVGSGAGDVTFLAGDLVSPSGMVVGVEHELTLLEIARARARAAGIGYELLRLAEPEKVPSVLLLAPPSSRACETFEACHSQQPVASRRVASSHSPPDDAWV